MSAKAIEQMAGRISALMEERLGAKGTTLDEKLRARGRLLPRKVRRAARELAETEAWARNPRLRPQVHPEKTAAAYDLCLRHLNGMGRAGRIRARLLGLAASLVLIVLVVGTLAYGVMRWRGLV